jgi:hypothetical protein
MRIFWVLLFAAMMAYVAWWLIGSIREKGGPCESNIGGICL